MTRERGQKTANFNADEPHLFDGLPRLSLIMYSLMAFRCGQLRFRENCAERAQKGELVLQHASPDWYSTSSSVSIFRRSLSQQRHQV